MLPGGSELPLERFDFVDLRVNLYAQGLDGLMEFLIVDGRVLQFVFQLLRIRPKKADLIFDIQVGFFRTDTFSWVEMGLM